MLKNRKLNLSGLTAVLKVLTDWALEPETALDRFWE